VGRYLPDYPNRDVATQVTVNELLNHAGGVGDFFGPEFEAHRDTLVDPKDYVALFGPRPLLFTPGSQQAYSNYGYILLGRIIEVASGQPYDRYVAEHIFRPARMTGSGFRPETERVPGRVVGYATQNGALVPATKFQVLRGTPGGGSYATAPDMVRFADALMDGRLLGRPWLKRLTKTGTPLPNGATGYDDFGGRRTADGQLYLGHGGAAPGQDGVLHIFPDSGYTVVVLANRDPSIAELIAKFIEERTP
jgi:CubicO group peptidase (beta-lactamase class C family)